VSIAIYPDKRSNATTLQLRRLVPGQCRACGREFLYRRTGRPRNFCDQKCRQSAFRQCGGYPPSQIAESVRKKEATSKLSSPDFGDRGSASWRVVAGPELDLRWATVGSERIIEADKRARAKLKDEAGADAHCLIKRHDPPVNVVGGYKFPNAPAVDLTPPSRLPQSNELLFQTPLDLSIPAFLKRSQP